MLHLLGIDHQRSTVKYQGLDFRLTGVEPARGSSSRCWHKIGFRLHHAPLHIHGSRLAIFACACWASAAEPTAHEVREFQETKAKAEAGDVNAQYKLGGMFGKGAGVPRTMLRR